MSSLIQKTFTRLKGSLPFALTTIISHQGSTPRTSGSKMLIDPDRTISGTIGGGLVEANVIDACTGLMGDTRPASKIMKFTLDQEIKQGMDMVCGGSLKVWIQTFIPPFPTALISVYETLKDIETQGKKAIRITRIQKNCPKETCLVLDKKEIIGPRMLPKPLFDAVRDNKFTGPGPFREFHGLEEFMIEPLSPPDTLYIFGAGHVGFQLAQMAHLTDFACVVTDDRTEFANAQRFPHARGIHAPDDFSRAFAGLTINQNAYIVILTRGHLHDQTVLEQALKTDAAYIGMIGSKKKREQIYTNLMEKGVDKALLDRVYSPIGLKIKAETPAEIAVSIMGELIMTRAKNKENSI